MRTIFSVILAVLVAGAVMAGETSIPDRLDKIKAGEWVTMRDVSGGDRAGERNTITVVKVEGDTITLRREHFAADGSVIESRERDMDLARMKDRIARLQTRAKSVVPGFMTIKDKEIPVVAVTFEGEDKEDVDAKREFTIWLSAELPVGGIAKTWCSDAEFPQAEVVDYGF